MIEEFVKLDQRFKYIYQSKCGLSAARNVGIGVCAGLYIQFLDADDMLEEKKLERQVAYLEKHPETDIVYGHVRYFKELNEIPIPRDISKHGGEWMPRVSGDGRDVLGSLIRENIMVVNAPLIRKSVVETVGGFNQNLSSLEDWDYWIRCAQAGKRFQYINEDGTLALVRVHHSSMSQNIMPMLMSNIKVREQLQRSSLPLDLYKLNDYQIGLKFAKIAQFEFMQGDLLHGVEHAVMAIWRSYLTVSISILIQLFLLLFPERIAKPLESAARRLHVLP